MKRILAITLGVCSAIFLSLFFVIIISLAIYVPKLIHGRLGLLPFENQAAQPYYPAYYHWFINGMLLVEAVGAVTIAYIALRLFKFIIKRIRPFKYQTNKAFYLLAAYIFIVVAAILLVLVSAEMFLRNRPTADRDVTFIGGRLLPPNLWTTRDSSDDRGMNFIHPNYFFGDYLHKTNKQGFLAEWDYTPGVIDSFRKNGYKIAFIIGDSFTEGITSGTWDHTMCEMLKKDLSRQKYLICPFGVLGTDVLQYELVCQRYVPLLKPDEVIINFCGGNDFATYERKPAPHIPILYQTNIGGIYSDISGRLLPTPDSAYSYYRKLSPLATGPWLCRHSYLCCMVYKKYFAKEKLPPVNNCTDEMATYRQLAAIKKICLENRALFHVLFIPDYKAPCLNRAQVDSMYAGRFGDIYPDVSFYLKGDITRADYISSINQHFNDAGNRKFEQFMREEILNLK